MGPPLTGSASLFLKLQYFDFLYLLYNLFYNKSKTSQQQIEVMEFEHLQNPVPDQFLAVRYKTANTDFNRSRINIVSDIAIFVLKRDVKLQLTNVAIRQRSRTAPSIPHTARHLVGSIAKWRQRDIDTMSETDDDALPMNTTLFWRRPDVMVFTGTTGLAWSSRTDRVSRGERQRQSTDPDRDLGRRRRRRSWEGNWGKEHEEREQGRTWGAIWNIVTLTSNLIRSTSRPNVHVHKNLRINSLLSWAFYIRPRIALPIAAVYFTRVFVFFSVHRFFNVAEPIFAKLYHMTRNVLKLSYGVFIRTTPKIRGAKTPIFANL